MAQNEHHAATGKDWLAAWDEGGPIWSVEMGGIGPGYEQAIQVTAAEILRFMTEEGMDTVNWENTDGWAKDRERIEKAAFANPLIEQLGLSGAQYGAAVNLAAIFHKRGPRDALSDQAVKDRLILVSKPSPAFASA